MTKKIALIALAVVFATAAGLNSPLPGERDVLKQLQAAR